MTTEHECMELMRQAKKKAEYTSWFGGNRLDEAVELYTKAGNSYKLLKKC